MSEEPSRFKRRSTQTQLGEAVDAKDGHSRNGAGHPSDELMPKPFPLHCLPPAFGAMARAIAETERTPESLAGCCTLGILSASIGRGLRVRSGPNRWTRGNLSIVASAESGSGKSEVFRHAAQPFNEFEREIIDKWNTSTLPRLQADKDLLEAEIKKLKSSTGNTNGTDHREEVRVQLERKRAELAAVERSIHAPVLSVEDVTTERLAVLLSVRDETLASLSPDAGAIVNNLLGRYSKLERTDETIYLKAYSGDYCRIDRQSREPVVLNSPCVSALWLTQPDKIETLLGERSLTDGGLIPRLLICHTNADARPIVEGLGGVPEDVRQGYRKIIRALLEEYRLASEERTIEPTPEALAAMNAHFNGIVERRLTDLHDITTFPARWNEQAWRFSVCIHAGLHGKRAHKQPLDLTTVQCAIELADWFAGQQLQVLQAGREKAHRELLGKVLDLFAGHPNGICATDLYRKRIVMPADAAHAFLARLETEGVLTGSDKPTQGGGHVTRIYTKARK